MNLREKFIWNIIILFSVSILLWAAWNQFNEYTKIIVPIATTVQGNAGQ